MKRIIFCGIFLMAAAPIVAAQSPAPPAPASQPRSIAPQSQTPAATQTPAASPTPVRPPAPPVQQTNLKVGDKAPDFTLPSTIASADGRSAVRYKLSDFQGKKNVVLAFFVLAFTGG